MKKHILFLLLIMSAALATAQSPDLAEHRIVIQFTSGDTAVHRAMLRQLGNILAAAPNSRVEVVCHGSGISLLQKSKSSFPDKVRDYHEKGIYFVACENTIRERKIDKADILPEAGFVRSGIMEVVNKQEEGWSYIRAGQ